MEALAGIFLLSTLVEGVISYLFGTPKEGEPPRNYLKLVSLGLGVAACIAYQVDIPAMAGLVSPFPFVSFVVSGLIIGRGSNYLNDIVSKFRRT